MIISLSNQKGGVGKTTLAFNLAHLLSEEFKILAVDLDPQGNLSLAFGVEKEENRALAIFERSPKIDPIPISEQIDLVPSNIELSRVESNVTLSTYGKLKNALREARGNYDFIIIDCPPSLGVFTLSAFMASDFVLVPITPALFSLAGTRDLIDTVYMIKQDGYNPSIEMLGFVLNMVDRTTVARSVEGMLRENFGDKVFRTFIPRTVRVEEAVHQSKPVHVCFPNHKAAFAFRSLKEELLERLGYEREG